MADSLLQQLMTRGEGFLTEVSNNLMSNPTFLEMLNKGIAAKEAVDKQVAETLKRMNVATRKDLQKLEGRLQGLEARLAELAEMLAAGRAVPKSSPGKSSKAKPKGGARSR